MVCCCVFPAGSHWQTHTEAVKQSRQRPVLDRGLTALMKGLEKHTSKPIHRIFVNLSDSDTPDSESPPKNKKSTGKKITFKAPKPAHKKPLAIKDLLTDSDDTVEEVIVTKPKPKSKSKTLEKKRPTAILTDSDTMEADPSTGSGSKRLRSSSTSGGSFGFSSLSMSGKGKHH